MTLSVGKSSGYTADMGARVTPTAANGSDIGPRADSPWLCVRVRMRAYSLPRCCFSHKPSLAFTRGRADDNRPPTGWLENTEHIFSLVDDMTATTGTHRGTRKKADIVHHLVRACAVPAGTWLVRYVCSGTCTLPASRPRCAGSATATTCPRTTCPSTSRKMAATSPVCACVRNCNV